MLPPDALDLVDRTVSAARLSRHERERVRAELETHFLDGMAAGASVTELVLRFGNPALTAVLIRRCRPRARRALARTALLTAACAAACYLVAFVRLETARGGERHPRFEDDAVFVSDRISQARTYLQTSGGVWAAYRVAADLRRRRSMWAESPSILLLAETFAAAQAALSESEQRALRDSLRALAAEETLLPRREILEPGIDALSSRTFGENGRVDRAGLRLLRQAKGGQSLGITGRLLEPLYFAWPMSPSESRRLVRSYVASETRRASSAGLDLQTGL